ncbi:MAG: T9SS type A sorting domain-containing protein [Elusimicrobia bacterium]|nr:T9SS type A sorting domain-containing protein [Elusimicrobiota bacterium]
MRQVIVVFSFIAVMASITRDAGAVHSYSSATFNASGDGRDVAYAVTVDQDGYVYLAGSVYETAGGENIWIGKYSSSLSLVSSTSFRATGALTDRAFGIHAATNGYVYVSGYVRESSGRENAWLAKYDNSLVLQTSVTFAAGGGLADSAGAVVLDDNGNVIVCGYVTESSSGEDFWLARYSGSNLAFLSSTSIVGAGSGEDRCNSLVVNPVGRIYAVGSIADPSGKEIILLSRFSRALVLQTTATFSGPGTGDESARAVALDGDGNVYAAGFISHPTQGTNAWIAKYGGSLVLLSSVTVNDSAGGEDMATSIAMGSSGDVYVGGVLEQSSGGQNIWLARYDSSLVFKDSITIRGLGSLTDLINGIVIDDNSDLYAVGLTSVPVGENIWLSKHSGNHPISGSGAASVSSGSGDSTLEYAAGSFAASSVTVVFNEYVSASSVAAPAESSLSLDTATIVDVSVVDAVSSATLQPSGFVSVRLRYDLSRFDSSAALEELYVGRYESGKGWSLLETSRNSSSSTVTGLANHLSQFGVLRRDSASGFNSVKIYPNPFWPARGHQKIFFDNVPALSSIEIYTITGLQVQKLDDTDGDGRILWDAKNAAGLDAGSGVYLALIQTGSEKKVFKFAVER